MNYYPTRVKGSTISDPDGPLIVVSGTSGCPVERGDGEVRTFRTFETAQRCADRINRQLARELLARKR